MYGVIAAAMWPTGSSAATATKKSVYAEVAGSAAWSRSTPHRAAILTAVRVVAAGEALLASSVTRRLIERFAAQPSSAARSPSALAQLTERESEVFVLVAQGLSNAEIAN